MQQKRELEKKQEVTAPADITVEDNVLSVAGRIYFSRYEKLQPVYTEYNVGYYRRSGSAPKLFSAPSEPSKATSTRRYAP